MFVAFWLAKNMEVRREESCHLFAPRSIQVRPATHQRRFAAACLIAAMGGLPLAHGDDGRSTLAPVFNNLPKENRLNDRAPLPPVIYRTQAANRSEPGRVSDSVSSRATVRFGETDNTRQQTVLPPVLAPVIRGRPTRSKGHERTRKQPTPVTIERAERDFQEGIRSSQTRDRTAMSLPAGIPNSGTAAKPNIVAKLERKLNYGETPELSAEVMIDLSDDLPSIAANEESSTSVPGPPRLSPVLLDPKCLAPIPNQLLTNAEPISGQEENLINAGRSTESMRSSARMEYFQLRQPGRDSSAFQRASVIPSAINLQTRLAARQPSLQPPPIPSDLKGVLPETTPAKTDPNGKGLPNAKSPDSAYDDEVFRPIQRLGVDITPAKGDLPHNRAATRFARSGEQVQATGYSRNEPEKQFAWDAPALCHRPLFFEDVNLERHGYHVKYIQPFLSAAHFFSRVPELPYLAVSERSRVCNYTLGHYQPGSYAPHVWYYPRPSLTGTAIEGAVVTGLILAIP